MRGSMHELSKQFLRPSSPSGSQKSSRYKQLEDGGEIFVWISRRMFSKEFNVHKTQCVLVYNLTTRTLSCQVEELHQIQEVQQVQHLHPEIQEQENQGASQDGVRLKLPERLTELQEAPRPEQLRRHRQLLHRRVRLGVRLDLLGERRGAEGLLDLRALHLRQQPRRQGGL